MQPMTVTEIASAVKGSWWNPSEQVPRGERRFHGQPEDRSRRLFLPWVGEKFDGHQFIDGPWTPAPLGAGARGPRISGRISFISR